MLTQTTKKILLGRQSITSYHTSKPTGLRSIRVGKLISPYSIQVCMFNNAA